jgi:D-3-phosphoglycerate dehydrogenase
VGDCLSEKTIGIIGYGKIGHNVAERLKCFGCKIIVSDPYVSLVNEDDMGISVVEFEDLLVRSDIISIHTPLTPETHHLISDYEFELMKENAQLINVSRGPIIDEVSLQSALEDNIIDSVALDVFETEPPAKDNPLLNNPRVVKTPHVAWQSIQADKKRFEAIPKSIRVALNGEVPPNAVNSIN